MKYELSLMALYIMNFVIELKIKFKPVLRLFSKITHLMFTFTKIAHDAKFSDLHVENIKYGVFTRCLVDNNLW